MEHSFSVMPVTGNILYNTKGIPGTLGCVVYSNDHADPVFLTNYHVLFGNSGKVNDAVWLMRQQSRQQFLFPAGKTLKGKVGNINYKGKSVFIDCALVLPPDGIGAFVADVHQYAEPVEGETVTKNGGATNDTIGIISAVDHNDVCNIGGVVYQASNQLLIQSADQEKFCDKGDSGAAIMNSHGQIIGLLWGVTAKGEGIACPVGAVIAALNIRLPHI